MIKDETPEVQEQNPVALHLTSKNKLTIILMVLVDLNIERKKTQEKSFLKNVYKLIYFKLKEIRRRKHVLGVIFCKGLLYFPE